VRAKLSMSQTVDCGAALDSINSVPCLLFCLVTRHGQSNVGGHDPPFRVFKSTVIRSQPVSALRLYLRHQQDKFEIFLDDHITNK
jgi:hypothetical protein